VHPRRLTSPARPLRLSGVPLTSVGHIRMYVCGVTPYDVTHLGHASAYVWADAADRVLRWAGHRVSVARNVTDVDEVLYLEAARRGAEPTTFGAVQRAAFEATMSTLRVRTPDASPTVAQAISNVIQLGAALLVHGAAYERDGAVYARTARSAAAAGIDHATAITLAAEYRDAPEDPRKEDPLDVLVWRAAAAGDPVRWPSPWGQGRPGWHAGCAAMVLSQFGSSVDLHCGGADLRFPHHACETVMAEAATGVAPFARAWLRAGTVAIGGQKMAKSTGNLVLVDDLLRNHAPAVLRMLCLHRPWASGWSFEPAALDTAAATLDQLYAAAAHPGDTGSASCDALLEDLDVPRAIQIALESGGSGARELIDVLALS
jgi:cysteinyl-tRNA synthetase